jgi:TPR repeat protein
MNDEAPSRNLAPVFFALAIVTLIITFGLIYWLAEDEPVAASPPLLDKAAHAMPFEQPVAEPVAQLSGVPDLPERAERIVRLRRAFFAGDFELLDQALQTDHQQALAETEGSVRFDPFVASLKDTHLAGIERCAQWLEAMPESYNAHYICAQVWSSGAWDVRSAKRMHLVSEGQWALMRERLHISTQLAERALLLDPAPFEALTLLAINHFALGTGMAPEYYARAEQMLPRYLGLQESRTNFSQPQWGGSQELVKQSIEMARAAGISESDLLDLEDEYIAEPTLFSEPGATRAYWENAINLHSTEKRLIGLMYNHAGLQNWKETAVAAEALLAAYPDSAIGHYWLGQARKMLGQIPEAREAFLMAAGMGHDDAMQELIMAYVRGGLGIDDSYDGPTLPELCHYSAALGSAIGANCLGAAYFEGGQPGVPFAKNPAQGYAWHLVAARAGHYNSQFDLGWMLYTGRVPGITNAQGQDLGIFWLRRAAEKGHVFAGRRLDELDISRSESLYGQGRALGLPEPVRVVVGRIAMQLHILAARIADLVAPDS